MRPWQQGLILMWRFLGRGRSRATAVILAVAWGTLAMMMLLAFGEGLQRQLNTGQLGLGMKDPVILWAGNTTRPWQGMPPGRRVRFTHEDLAALRREIPELDDVAGERGNSTADLRWGENMITGRVTGVMPCYEEMRSHFPQPGGRFLNDTDMIERRRVIFLGSQIKQRLMGDAEAVGETVYLSGTPFTVIGVMIDKMQMGCYGGEDQNKAAIPLPTYEALYGLRDYQEILYTVHPPHTAAEIEDKVRGVFARRQRFDPEDESTVYFWDTQAGRQQMYDEMKTLKTFLGLVGAMTILVAGVGLANMLFVMVRRRTREIGLQMAIGAQRRAISTRVIGEALVLAGLGGYLGIALSWLITELLHRMPIENEALQVLGKPTLALPLAIVTVVVLAGIACLAGILPARRATKLNPVEALRYE